MRHFLLGLCLLLLFLPFCAIAQDDIQLKEYSYAQLFQMIEDEEDSVFRLENALILFDSTTDEAFIMKIDTTNTKFGDRPVPIGREETLIINKAIELNNVNFPQRSDDLEGFDRLGFYNIQFNKAVSFKDFLGFVFEKSTFKSGLSIDMGLKTPVSANKLKEDYQFMSIDNSKIEGRFQLVNEDKEFSPLVFLENNQFENGSTSIFLDYARSFVLRKNIISSNSRINVFLPKSIEFQQVIVNNSFDSYDFSFDFNPSAAEDDNTIAFNNIVKSVQLSIGTFDAVKGLIDWNSFSNKIINSYSFIEWRFIGDDENYDRKGFIIPDTRYNEQSTTDYYLNHARIENELVFNAEIAIRGKFYDYYQGQHDRKSANAVYSEMKALETQRLKYLYQEDPNFDAFFKWKINQFLEVFSAYGTEPAKAVSFSVYVILVFAFVYFFFPNHWDSHGKNRIKDRFLFFHKYLRLNKGIHDVYMEEQDEELQNSHSFRKVLDDHKEEVPAFFYNAAKPLLRWSTAGITVYSKILSKVDFLKGTWKDTDPKVRGIKTALTIFIFIIALTYDILIKMLNALMLSINTFTTLGFGEIPIKGLPRYLAIIQGFIGWFMLTIFSVSLISQLLN